MQKIFSEHISYQNGIKKKRVALYLLEQQFIILKLPNRGFLVVQWLRLCAPNAGGPGVIPGHGTRPHMPHRRVHIPQ